MYGRGGAGNINAAKETSKRAAEDIEANRTPTSTTAPPTQPSSASQEYSHMGRGGAGNWYQPSELQKEGTFTQPSDSTAIPTTSKPQISTPWHPEGQEMPVARSGRGGAGNFVWKSEEQAKKEREDEERRREVVREGVERDVEAGLAKPPGALLGRETERGW
ncbi:Nn.00g026140.m01.CDS01 [Neocucurbitaria sp. VM-36]